MKKSHKYISRKIGASGEYIYKYPKDQPRSVSRKQAKITIAKKSHLITGIKPEWDITKERIDWWLNKYKEMSEQGVLRCVALGNANIHIINKTKTHLFATLGVDRTRDAISHKAQFLPFVKEVLIHGKLCEVSRNGKHITYGVIAQAEYIDGKTNKKVKTAIELAIAYDEEARKYLLSFSDMAIKKAILTDSSLYGPLRGGPLEDSSLSRLPLPLRTKLQRTNHIQPSMILPQSSKKSIEEGKKMLFIDDWDVLIKSHLYSRKEFKNGAWRYYYDKHNNFSRMTRCNASTLDINISMPRDEIIRIAKDYINNVWLADWKEHPEKAICRELKDKKICFKDISIKHIKIAGSNSAQAGIRDKPNLINHLKYLPLAKELLESNGVHTQSRYQAFTHPLNDGAIGIVYQSISGLAPLGDKNNKYVQVTVSQKKYKNGELGDTVYISVVGTEFIKKSLYSTVRAGGFVKDITSTQEQLPLKLLHIEPTSGMRRHPSLLNKTDDIIPQSSKKSSVNNNKNTTLSVILHDITEGNRFQKAVSFAKALRAVAEGRVYRCAHKIDVEDNTKVFGDLQMRLHNFDISKIDKAVRAASFALDVPVKSGDSGEQFIYGAHEDLCDKWAAEFSSILQNLYDLITAKFDLPNIKFISKSEVLKWKGKILYSPETGEPIKRADWDKFVKDLEKFLNRKCTGSGGRIVLQGDALGHILNRMLQYNTLEAVTRARLDKLKYHGKTFDWIASNIKNMKSVFGEALTRDEMARIQVMSDSAAMRVTRVTDNIKSDIKQILIDGVKARSGKSKISQALFDKMVGYNRDYQRIADTETMNAMNNAMIKEEVYRAGEGEKVYFRRLEVLDKNTCDFCRRMDGAIALWSDVPLEGKVKDEVADYALWDGKEWSGGKGDVCMGAFHPWCRGTWVRYRGESKAGRAMEARTDAMSSWICHKRGEEWDGAVMQARDEWKARGEENPSDETAGYIERINELYKEAIKSKSDIQKSLTWSGHKLQGRRIFAGLPISIENRKGSVRSGVDPDGHEWRTKMNYAYGYIRGTEGVDGDHVDCYLGDNEGCLNVYIVHQVDPHTKEYDEDKVMLGFNSYKEARAAFLSQYDSPDFLGQIDTVPLEVFKERIKLKMYRGKRLDLVIKSFDAGEHPRGYRGRFIDKLKWRQDITKDVAVGMYPNETWDKCGENIYVAESRKLLGDKNNVERKKIEKELGQAEILAEHGHVVYLLPELNDGKKHCDAVVDGKQTEFKQVTGSIDKVENRFESALKQAESVFIKTSGKTEKGVYKKLVGTVKEMLKRGSNITSKGKVYVSIDNNLISWKIEQIIEDAKQLL